MSKRTVYRGSPLSVDFDYAKGNFVIYDVKNKTYGKRYQSLAPAKKHAQEWNRIYKNRKK